MMQRKSQKQSEDKVLIERIFRSQRLNNHNQTNRLEGEWLILEAF
jgi:hypothetical protein